MNHTKRFVNLCPLSLLGLFLAGGCSSGGGGSGSVSVAATAESCMSCHNGGNHDDYSGPGMENPHPFPGAATLKCTECHGGDPKAGKKKKAHIPPPPEIGDRNNLQENDHAYFNRLTLTGIDKFPDYAVDGVTYTALDYLQFINPGDLRVVTDERSCGVCHAAHGECVSKSLLATESGVFSGAMFSIGIDNQVPQNQGLYDETAADLAFRAMFDPNFVFDPNVVGPVEELFEFPVFSRHGDPTGIFENPAYDNPNLDDDQLADGRVVSDSELSHLYHEQIAFTCGNCHLGSAGANNRYGDFRSSGCTACHMRKSLSGRANESYWKINQKEPVDPDNIAAPELSHVQRHVIVSRAQTLTTGEFMEGMDDYTCAGCHQGSNRTVMQYWGIRLDQNADLARRVQYPADPVSFTDTRNDTRLFDPVVNNTTFNGRAANQYILHEDYDGDGRDDTPPDIHYEAGLGCIDCHGSHDLHGGVVGRPDQPMLSHQEQAVAIQCESCHGGVEAEAATVAGQTYDGSTVEMAVDGEGNPLKHVIKEGDGNFYLTSRLTGNRHFVVQTRDVVVDSGKVNPLDGQPIYNAKASYAMGRKDGDPSTGIGPQQTGGALNGFSHSDEMSCVSCHASWTNNCIGCHLWGEYDDNFSNITGDKIVFEENEAQFVYQNPVLFQLGVDTHNKIAPIAPNTETFFKWIDRNNVESKVFSFSDRNGAGNNPGAVQFPSLSHNAMMPHSIRGRVTSNDEGPRYCVACHLTDDALANHGAEYDTFRTAMAVNDFAQLDFVELQQHIGQNPGNQLNSPFWVHTVAGLGSGLYLFDEFGCPVNPLDTDDQRFGCNDVAPAATFDLTRVRLDLDQIVDSAGVAQGSNAHLLLTTNGSAKRDGAVNPNFAGPLGATLIERLCDPVNGIVLDSWLNADGNSEGDAGTFVP